MTLEQEPITRENPTELLLTPELSRYNLDALESLTIEHPDSCTFYTSTTAAASGIRRSELWQKGKNTLLSPHQQLREIEERLKKEATAYVLVVGGGATATGAMNKLLEKTGGQNIVVINLHDKKDLAGQTKKIEWNIHSPGDNQKHVVVALSGPVLSIGERLSEDAIGDVARDLKVDFIIDARGLTPADEKRLTTVDGAPLKDGVDHNYLVSRDIIDLVNHAENELAQGRPEAMIELYETLDLRRVVISGAGKVGTQDIVTKVRLLQVGQKVYSETGQMIDFQKFAAKEKDSFSINLKQLGLTLADLGKITVVNRSLPRIIDPKPEHQADAFINLVSNPTLKDRRRVLYKKIVELESSSVDKPIPTNTALEIVNRYYQQLSGKNHIDAYTPLIKKLKKETRDLLNSFFDEEEIRKHSPKFRDDTEAKLKVWQDEFGFEFVEGVTPNNFDASTGKVGYDRNNPNAPSDATLLLSALGVNKYDYPASWEPIPGKVAGMRAVGSGNISASVAHVKNIIETFLLSIASRDKKSVAQNHELHAKFTSLLSTYNEGQALEAMVEHSPWLLIKDWLVDPIASSSLDDFNLELTGKVNDALLWESQQLLTHIATKMSKSTDNPLLNSLKTLKTEALSIKVVNELGRSYQEIVIKDFDLPFRLRLDEHGKLFFAELTSDNRTNWIKINNLTQLDYQIRIQLMIDTDIETSYSGKEDKLLNRFTTTKNAVEDDLLRRYILISLRNKFHYSNEDLLKIDLTSILEKLEVSQSGIKLHEYHSKLNQSEFDQVLDLWYSNQKARELGSRTIETLSKYKSEAIAAVAGLITGAAASLLNFDPKTLVELTALGLAVDTVAAAAVSNARVVFPQHKEKLDRAARLIELLGVGLLGTAAGFGLVEFTHPSPTAAQPLSSDSVDTHVTSHKSAASLDLSHGSSVTAIPSETTITPTDTYVVTPTDSLIPSNFANMTDPEILEHVRTVLGDANWVNKGPYLGYNGRPVDLADVVTRMISANRGDFTREEIDAVRQVANTTNLAELIKLKNAGLYQIIFGN